LARALFHATLSSTSFSAQIPHDPEPDSQAKRPSDVMSEGRLSDFNPSEEGS